MSVRRIEQGVVTGTQCVARSPGFDDAAAEAAEQIVRDFGRLPEGGESLVVVRLDRFIGVAQVRGSRWHFLALPVKLYRAIHDPFLIAATFPPDFSAHGDLMSLDWTEPVTERTLAQVQATLQTGDGPTLLGTAQALVDGGHVVFERPGPDVATFQALWSLLPSSTRGELTLSTFAPNNNLRFHLLATPNANGPQYQHYLLDRFAGDYPEGRYELALQLAAETNDADAIDRLLARRSISQAVRLALLLLIASILLGVAVRIIPWDRLR